MNALTRESLALVCEYLEDFIRWLGPVWGANGCLLSLWEDGSIDQALQALRANDPKRAAEMLALAAEQASEPVGWDEHKSNEAQEERCRIALAVRVARALLERAGLASHATSASPDRVALPCRVCDDGAPLDLEVEPLVLPDDFLLTFELLPEPDACHPLPGSAGAAAQVQGGAA